MEKFDLDQARGYIRFSGRTFTDLEKSIEFFNWTCSGFEVRFTGKKLSAELISIPARVPMTQEELYDFPWIAVLIDGSEAFSQRFELAEGVNWYTLFESDTVETHTIRVLKLSENARGKTGLKGFETDGVLESLPAENSSLRLEFVGDSITCGYGNEADNKDAPFITGEENGWITYGALAARELGAQFSCISVSGISVAHAKRNKFPFPHPFPAMENLYRFTDRLYEQGDNNPGDGTQWDFEANPVNAVVLNLGTNDVNAIKMADPHEKDEEEDYFAQKYTSFIQTIRQLNGPETYILCTLGPLDYYLYNTIEKTVERYIGQSGDSRVGCYKFGGVNLFTEGFGAIGHPSEKTHRRMADELVCQLKMRLEILKGEKK